MTPQELVALPVGTKVRMNVGTWNTETETREDDWDTRVITRSGTTCQIMWEGDVENIIPTDNQGWAMFIGELRLMEDK